MTASSLTAVTELLSGEASSFIFGVSPAEPVSETEINVQIKKVYFSQISNKLLKLLTTFLKLYRFTFNRFRRMKWFLHISGQLIVLKVKNVN